MAQNYYSCYQPMYRIIADTQQPDFNYETETEAEIPCENTLVNEDRSPRDVERVVRMIEKDARKELKELQRIGIDSRILNYLITSMVSYSDRNYNKYKGPFEQKMRAAERDLRRDLYWVFDIFRVMSASPATVERLTETVVSTSLRHLRPVQPPPQPGPPPPPSMPRH
jgi:hypothetical protein